MQIIIQYLHIRREFLQMHTDIYMHIYVLLNLIVKLHKNYFNFPWRELQVKYIVIKDN